MRYTNEDLIMFIENIDWERIDCPSNVDEDFYKWCKETLWHNTNIKQRTKQIGKN